MCELGYAAFMTREIDPKLADSDAARLLAGALSRASKERGLSLRKIGPLLDYKQAVVLSHMATGRVPIPIDKAEKIAEVLEINPQEFLKAVVKQRYPEVTWSLLSDATRGDDDSFLEGLAAGLGQIGNDLNSEQFGVMREVAADPHPRRRWLSTDEAAAIEILRAVRSDAEPAGKPVKDYPRAAEERALGPK